MKIHMSLFVAFAAIVLLTAPVKAGQQAANSPSCYDETPLPLTADVIVSPKEVVPKKHARFIGSWTDGKWSWYDFDDIGGFLCNTLVVTSVRKDGTADIIYSWGNSAKYSVKASWAKIKARITGNKIVLQTFRNGADVHYVIDDSGLEPVLKGTYENKTGKTFFVALKKRQ